MRMAAIAALGLMLAACDGGKAPATNDTVGASTADPMEAKIAALNDGQKKATFAHAIYDADYDCGGVLRYETMPRDDGRARWRVICKGEAEFIVTLVPGGSFNVSGIPRGEGPRFPKATATAAPLPPPR